MKRFVLASVIYLALAAGLGVWNGVGDPVYWAVFAHTHFNLLGFMSMMVFAIGYFILPRFNGVELRFPAWVPVHFWLANISLMGMVIFRGLGAEHDVPVINILFVVSATVQVITVLMFVVNLWLTLSTAGGEVAKPSAKSSPPKSNP